MATGGVDGDGRGGRRPLLQHGDSEAADEQVNRGGAVAPRYVASFPLLLQCDGCDGCVAYAVSVDADDVVSRTVDKREDRG